MILTTNNKRISLQQECTTLKESNKTIQEKQKIIIKVQRIPSHRFKKKNKETLVNLKETTPLFIELVNLTFFKPTNSYF